MAITEEEVVAASSTSGGTLGEELSITLLFPSDGDVVCIAVIQDNPGTAISMDTTGWTTMESVDLGHGQTYWFGYIYWHTGDSHTLPTIETTEPSQAVATSFAGTSSSIVPLHAQRAVANSESPVATPSIPDTSTSGGNVGVGAILKYNAAGDGGFGSPFTFFDFTTQADSDNITPGDMALLGYKIGVSDGSNFGPLSATPRNTIVTGNAAYSFLAVFFTPGTVFVTGGCSVGRIRIG